jgi:hypothetical protein
MNANQKDMDNIHIVSAILTVAKILCVPSEKRKDQIVEDDEPLIGFFSRTDRNLLDLFSETDHNVRQWLRNPPKQA